VLDELLDFLGSEKVKNTATVLATVFFSALGLWFTRRTRKLDEQKKRLDAPEAEARSELALNITAKTIVYETGDDLFIETVVQAVNPSRKNWAIPAAYISYRALIDTESPAAFTGRERFADLPRCDGLVQVRNRAFLPKSVWFVGPDESGSKSWKSTGWAKCGAIGSGSCRRSKGGRTRPSCSAGSTRTSRPRSKASTPATDACAHPKAGNSNRTRRRHGNFRRCSRVSHSGHPTKPCGSGNVDEGYGGREVVNSPSPISRRASIELGPPSDLAIEGHGNFAERYGGRVFEHGHLADPR